MIAASRRKERKATLTTGEKIKEARKTQGMTQVELAQKIGCSQANLAQYETGKRIPRPEMLEKIAAILDVRVYDLYGDDTFVRKIGSLLDNVMEAEIDKVFKDTPTALTPPPNLLTVTTQDGAFIDFLEAIGYHTDILEQVGGKFSVKEKSVIEKNDTVAITDTWDNCICAVLDIDGLVKLREDIEDYIDFKIEKLKREIPAEKKGMISKALAPPHSAQCKQRRRIKPCQHFLLKNHTPSTT